MHRATVLFCIPFQTYLEKSRHNEPLKKWNAINTDLT